MRGFLIEIFMTALATGIVAAVVFGAIMVLAWVA